MSNLVKIFVYGTLKQGFPNHHLLSNPLSGTTKLLCSARTENCYPLVVASDAAIPFMMDIPGKGQRVKGEVYEVCPQALVHLDKLEDHPRWYRRQPCQVVTEDSEPELMSCEAYFLMNPKDSLLQKTFLEEYSLDCTKEYVRVEGRTYIDLRSQTQSLQM
ncbi:predicted protein [Nematostella vectensis]|uniref:Gamma-glutamylcyclotransferase family protein n=1 Tax=Nematostella vectensis TaxID=45351 RepID=A7STA6_NEMVE|nr:putative gamma-glutamylcyclotransferase CG2811 [Nematostella vectensis]EDO33078.1 predicted protein [Nematostella vectensis]|eukprot:XP_001625178.1 predicted protein [Nematostella vectensis]